MLAPKDRRELLAALQAIGAADGIVDFAERVCRELLRLVPGVSASYNEVNLPAQRVAGIVYPDPGREWFEKYAHTFEANLRDNPLVRHFEDADFAPRRSAAARPPSRAGHPALGPGHDIVTWADLDPPGAFFDTALYREFYAPNGIHGQLAFLLPAPPGIHVGLAINRSGAEFSARERAMLAELRPHLVNLYRLVSHAEASRHRDAALAADGWSVILVDDEGTVLESNPATEALGRVAGIDLRAGASLRASPFWPVPSSAAQLDGTAEPAAEWTRGAPFEVRLVRSPVGPHVLWIREPSRVTVEDAVALGLTLRQAEIAVLLVDGLSNESIAARLNIAPGTVRAHLDAVFRRLDVSSRAAVVGRLQVRSGRRTTHPKRSGIDGF